MDDLRIPAGPGCLRGLVVPAGELVERFSHASGPGGQGVNTADSRVQLSLDLGSTSALGEKQRERALRELGERLTGSILTVTASENRSQRRNRAAARERLAEVLRAAFIPPVPRPSSRPSLVVRRSRRARPSCAAWMPKRGARRSRRAGAAPTRTKKNEVGASYAHSLPSVRQPINTQVMGNL